MKTRTPVPPKTAKASTAIQMPATDAHLPAPQEAIAVAAYFHAERRGFVPGGELDDWLQAEADCRTGSPRM